jgi:hypothetical protein
VAVLGHSQIRQVCVVRNFRTFWLAEVAAPEDGHTPALHLPDFENMPGITVPPRRLTSHVKSVQTSGDRRVIKPKMIMNRIPLLLLILACSFTAPAETTNQPSATGLASLGFLTGGTWQADLPPDANGQKAGIEARFEWTQNHQGIRFDSEWLVGDKKYPYTSGVYLWNPQLKQIVISYSDADGALTTGTVSQADEVFEHQLQVIYPSGKVEKVQTKLTHSGSSSFTNAIYRLKDGQWDKFVEVNYNKVKPAPPG